MTRPCRWMSLHCRRYNGRIRPEKLWISWNSPQNPRTDSLHRDVATSNVENFATSRSHRAKSVPTLYSTLEVNE